MDDLEDDRAEIVARAAAFQGWWSGAFGEQYRTMHPKSSTKDAAKDAFNAGWFAYGEAVTDDDELDALA